LVLLLIKSVVNDEILGLLFAKLCPFNRFILSAPVSPGNLFKVLPEFDDDEDKDGFLGCVEE